MASRSRGDAPSRRDLLARSGLALGAAALAPVALAQETEAPTDPDFADGEPHAPTAPEATSPPAPGTVDWTWVRGQWALEGSGEAGRWLDGWTAGPPSGRAALTS